jgi:tRNA uridine 5-carboxymethylaminomethyl modification enzyme
MGYYSKKYDVIVVGGGHAGCEGLSRQPRMGCRVLLLAIDLDKIAAMPCSPSIGGMAKGQLVKEIDALGGEMAKIADLSAIQYKTLNTKKGPAVQSTRTQNDKGRYHTAMKAVVENQPNLDLKQALVERLDRRRVEFLASRTTPGMVFRLRVWFWRQGTFPIRTGTHRLSDHESRPGR